MYPTKRKVCWIIKYFKFFWLCGGLRIFQYISCYSLLNFSITQIVLYKNISINIDPILKSKRTIMMNCNFLFQLFITKWRKVMPIVLKSKGTNFEDFRISWMLLYTTISRFPKSETSIVSYWTFCIS